MTNNNGEIKVVIIEDNPQKKRALLAFLGGDVELPIVVAETMEESRHLVDRILGKGEPIEVDVIMDADLGDEMGRGIGHVLAERLKPLRDAGKLRVISTTGRTLTDDQRELYDDHCQHLHEIGEKVSGVYNDLKVNREMRLSSQQLS